MFRALYNKIKCLTWIKNRKKMEMGSKGVREEKPRVKGDDIRRKSSPFNPAD